MKTFFTAALLTATILSTPASAFSLSMQGTIPDISFPDSASEPVTKGKINPGK